MATVDIEKAKLGRNIVIKLDDDNFAFWWNEQDRPCAWGATEEETMEILGEWAKVYGSQRELEQRVLRLIMFGTTEMIGRERSAEATCRGNHAGPNGEQLTFDAIKRYYGPGDAHEKFKLQEGDVIPWED